jgi:uncharacterized protein YgiM (DUF1202 family)
MEEDTHMKKTFSLLLALIMAFSLVAVLPTSAAAASYKGTVKLSSGTLNVRKTPSTSAAVVDKLRNGDTVTVSAQTTKSGEKWYKITTAANKTGYVMAKYITLSSKTSSGSSSTPTNATYTVRTKTMKIYQSRSGSSKLLATAQKGDAVTLLTKYTSGWAQVKYGSVTGYCNFNSLTASSTSGTGSSANLSPKFYEVSKPNYSVYTSKKQVTELLDYHLANFSSSFSFKVNNASGAALNNILPSAKKDALYGYLLSEAELKAKKLGSSVTYSVDTASKTVYATIHYNPAGLVLQHYKNGTPLTDSKAKELDNEVNRILKSLIKSGMSDYDKALVLHDYLCENVVYSNKDVGKTAYGAIVKGEANCQGYAEATGLLYTLAGLENVLVRATNDSTRATHGYVKVKVNGKWYCVDTTADDPMNNTNPVPRHDFFLVTDEIVEQRYTPWSIVHKLPKCTSMDENYYVKNNLVVSSMAEAKKIIQDAVKAKKPAVEFWMNDYSSSKYGTSTLRSYATSAGAKSVSMKSLALKRCSIYMILGY